MPSKKDIEQLVADLKKHSKAYYNKNPLISDDEYDALQEKLEQWDPTNPYLEVVGSEVIKGTPYKHKTPMLSTSKSKTPAELQAFVDRVLKEAKEIGITKPTFRVTPKLDGMAGKYIDDMLVTRGNGRTGTVVTSVFKLGVKKIGGNNTGVGEIVMSQSYFDEHLEGLMSHPRNVVTGCVNADTPSKEVTRALKAGKVHFMPYSKLPHWTGSATDLVKDIQQITLDIMKQVDYPLDGMVAEVVEDNVKKHMGATNHHHRWQTAIKTKGESKDTFIGEIGWQTGRTGVITPVLRLDPPVTVEGAVISNVTAHNAGTVKDKKLGVGAKVRIIRSGGVIPKLDTVLTVASKIVIPTKCPVCKQSTKWRNDFIICTNQVNCSAQTQTGLFYFFKTIENAKGFGQKTLETLVDNDYTTIESIFLLKKSDFITMKFGKKQAENLEEAIQTAIQTEIEDARFLASFGIPNLGMGASRKLLSHHTFDTLKELTMEQLDTIDGFGEKTSANIITAFKSRWPTIMAIYNLGFTLSKTPLKSEQDAIESPIAGKKILFTGKMKQNRDEMEIEARTLGATVLKGVSSKLEIMVTGTKASAGKVAKATKAGATILTEDEYTKFIGK